MPADRCACLHLRARRRAPTGSRVQVFRMFNLVPFSWGNIGWAALLRQGPKVLALLAVCAFGTSMDIMAVQAEAADEVDADWEVTSIGWANVLAGIVGGGGTGATATCLRGPACRPCLPAALAHSPACMLPPPVARFPFPCLRAVRTCARCPLLLPAWRPDRLLSL